MYSKQVIYLCSPTQQAIKQLYIVPDDIGSSGDISHEVSSGEAIYCSKTTNQT